jgi:hypothetical protein
MKTANTYFSSIYLGLCIGILCTMSQLTAVAQEIPSYQLITVDLAVQGETFTGTVVEKKKDGGYLPLAEGSLVSIQGQVVRAKRGGRVDIPPISGATCEQSLSVEILFDGRCREDLSDQSVFSSAPVAFVPRVSSGKTNILHAPRLIRPGRVFTTTGEGLDRIQTGGLRAVDGRWIPMEPVAGSSIQQKYLTPGSLPPGTYRFEAHGADGTVYESPVESVHPQLDMSGPSLKKVGQKGKIRIRAGADGTLTVWGGLPQIEWMPDREMRTGTNADGGEVLLIDARGGEWIEIPFVARMVGQYNVTADLRTPEEAREEYESGTHCDLLSSNTTVDPAAGVTRIETGIFVRETSGRPSVGTQVEVIVAHPGGMEMMSGVSNSAGLAVAKTALPGVWSEGSATVAAFRTAGGAWRQEPFFSGHTAAAFFNLDPGLGGDEEDEEALAEMYRRNKRQWGNYQGICGTALMEMCRLYPDLCEQFKKTEAEIEAWLLRRASGDDSSSTGEEMTDAPFDPAMADIYRENKRRWGNYQGICGTALMEMCRLYPEQCRKFKETEQAIEKWLQGLHGDPSDEKGTGRPGGDDRTVRPAEGASSPSDSDPGSGGQNDRQDREGAGEETDENPIPEEDRADLQNDVIRRAFEENDVTALRILEIKLGYRGAAVTRIGDQYYITYEKRVVFDPETGRPVNYWEFNEAQPLTAEDWYAIYLLSLGESPLNLLARIVESAESLGKEFLDDLFKDMQDKGDASRLLEIKAEHLILLHITASFDQGAMPQLGDHYREAEQHMNKALAAAERGDWATAIEEWQAAQSSMAWLALEVLPGAGAGAGKASRRAARPLIEVAQDATRNLDEVAEALRKAARSEANQDLAQQMSRRADAVEEMAEKAKKLNRVTDLGKARPANFPVAAKDRTSLEEYFGRDNVGTLGRRKPENVLVVTDANGNKQVWVNPEYSDYKGAYEAAHGPISKELNVDVDHLQSRTRGGQQGYGYVRLELVDSEVNQAWGRHMEKRTVNAGRAGFVEPAGPAPVRHIDQFQWWKLQGVSPARVEAWIRTLGE